MVVLGDSDDFGAWRARRHIRWASDSRVVFQALGGFAVVIGVVSEGNGVGACFEDFGGGVWGDAKASGGVFAVYYCEIGVMGFDE